MTICLIHCLAYIYPDDSGCITPFKVLVIIKSFKVSVVVGGGGVRG